jgi:tryptophan-rich sensory protein
MRVLTLVGLGALTVGAALFGGSAARRNLSWYRRLPRPRWRPPARALGPAGAAVYALMVGSAWRVLRTKPTAARGGALALWGAQLAFNAAWSPLFFELRQARASLVDVALLVGALGAYTLVAQRIDRPAAWMMLPSLGWSLYAAAVSADLARRDALQKT